MIARVVTAAILAAILYFAHFPLGNITLNSIAGAVVDIIAGWFLAGTALTALGLSQTSISSATKPADEPKPVKGEKQPNKPAKPAPPVRSDAINLLATLQREARFVDIVKEPLGDYTDEQVGAAARDVLRDCGTVLDRLFDLQPVIDEAEGANVDIPENADADQLRIAGNTANDPTSGSLVHHGWKAKQCQLPKWSGAKGSALIVAPAEVEVK